MMYHDPLVGLAQFGTLETWHVAVEVKANCILTTLDNLQIMLLQSYTDLWTSVSSRAPTPMPLVSTTLDMCGSRDSTHLLKDLKSPSLNGEEKEHNKDGVNAFI